jgi:hypothetical protein
MNPSSIRLDNRFDIVNIPITYRNVGFGFLVTFKPSIIKQIRDNREDFPIPIAPCIATDPLRRDRFNVCNSALLPKKSSGALAISEGVKRFKRFMTGKIPLAKLNCKAIPMLYIASVDIIEDLTYFLMRI